MSAADETNIQAGFYRDNENIAEVGVSLLKQTSRNGNSSQASPLSEGQSLSEWQVDLAAQWRGCALLDVIGSPDSVSLIDIPYLRDASVADLAGIGQDAASPFQRLALTLEDALLHLEEAAQLPKGHCLEVEVNNTSDAPGTAAETTDCGTARATDRAASADGPTASREELRANTVFTFEPWPAANGQRVFALDSLAFSRQAYWHDPAISPDLQPWPSREGICPNYRIDPIAPTSGAGERDTHYQVVSDCPGTGPRVVPTQETNARHVLGKEEETTVHVPLRLSGEDDLAAAEAPYAKGLLAAFSHCLCGDENGDLVTQATRLGVGDIVLGEPDAEQLQALSQPVTRAWHVPTADRFVRVLESDPIWNDEGDTALWLRAAVFAPGVGYVGTLRWSTAEDIEFAAANDIGVEWLLRGAAVGTTTALGGTGANPAWLATLVESVLDELRPQLPPAATRTQ
ncbi:MAG: hypothetical protein Q4P06_07175 [Actinomycetaceae bacterium]|nr:hypothetical protein [Actinomycetaceae bacterium]